MKLKKLSHKTKWGGLYLFAAAACFLIIANIIASQQLPTLFYSFIEGGRSSAVAYLTHIKPLPIFQTELLRYKNEYGQNIQEEVFREDVQRKREIESILKELKKQPRSRDLLYSLSLLYREDGNKKMEKLYLKKAIEIDPSLSD